MNSQGTSHIVILCSYLKVPGGYEKMMVSLANLFAEKGHKVSLLILDDSPESFYPLHHNVQLRHAELYFGIGKKGTMLGRKINWVKDIYKLGRILRELNPSNIICSEYHFAISAVLAGAKKYSQVVSWEHHHYGVLKMNGFWKKLFETIYPKLDAVVCLNEDERKFYLNYNQRALVIPNFIDKDSSLLPVKKDKNLILSVTRFNHIKGIDLLMQTAAMVLKKHPALKWKVIGYGEQYDALIKFVENQKLQARLLVEEASAPDITASYQEASLFVLTSRNECFPMTLLEAQNAGLPCISFDCDTGPRHIIKQGETGLLIEKENCENMAASIIQLMNEPARKENMSKNALAESINYTGNAIYPWWKALFNTGKN